MGPVACGSHASVGRRDVRAARVHAGSRVNAIRGFLWGFFYIFIFKKNLDDSGAVGFALTTCI